MRRYPAYLLLVITVGFLAGCHRSAELTPTPTLAVVRVAPISILPTPTSMPTPAVALSPLSTPVATTPPLPSLLIRGGSPIPGAPMLVAPLVVCRPQAEVFACYDNLLDMYFSYPDFMGPVSYVELRRGGYSGYSYEYLFEDSENEAGGRSRDFSEGRGPRYTDQGGFNGRTSANICAGWAATMCRELDPSALLIVILPQADWLCGNAMAFQDIPRGILVLDLPQHPLINGFAFSFPLMSPEAATAFRNEWYNSERKCAPETKIELGAYVEQLSQDLAVGVAPSDIQARYDAMLRLAQSVRSPFLPTNP